MSDIPIFDAAYLPMCCSGLSLICANKYSSQLYIQEQISMFNKDQGMNLNFEIEVYLQFMVMYCLFSSEGQNAKFRLRDISPARLRRRDKSPSRKSEKEGKGSPPPRKNVVRIGLIEEIYSLNEIQRG